MPQIQFPMTLGADVSLPFTWNFGSSVVPISPSAGMKEYQYQWTNTTQETVSLTYSYTVAGLGAQKVIVGFEAPAQSCAPGATVTNKLQVSVNSALAPNEQPVITVTGVG